MENVSEDSAKTAESGSERYSLSGYRPTFYSNAERAVEGVRQGQPLFSLSRDNGIEVPREEYAVIAHQIASYPKKAERGHVFTANNYYLCTDIDRDGNFKIVATLPIVGNEDLSMKSEEKEQTKTSLLSPLQRALLELLVKSKVEEDALVGTMLLLKDNEREMEDMLLYIWENKPTPEQIDEHLVEIVLARKK